MCIGFPKYPGDTGADPGVLVRGSYLHRGFELIIALDNLSFFLIFLKTLHENEIIMSQRGEV